MELNEIKENMLVRISKNIQKTEDIWTTTSEMKGMAGGIYRVRNVGNQGVSIYTKHGGAWTFCPEDLHPLVLTPPAKPVMFDPENIGE